MTVKRASTLSTRWDNSVLDEIEKLVKSPINHKGPFANTSVAIRECTKVGIKVHNYQEMMKDPEKADEFRKKMQDMIKNEEVFDWVHTLQPDQIDGFLMALQMEKDKRYEVKTLI